MKQTARLCEKMCAGARAALDLAVARTRGRVVSGRVLARHQSAAHRLAELWTLVEAAESLAREARRLSDAGDPAARRAVSAAKIVCSNAYLEAANTAIQLHGAAGFSERLPLRAHLRRALEYRELFGEPAAHAAYLASLLIAAR